MAEEVNPPLPPTAKTSWTIPLLLILSIFSLAVSGYLFWKNQKLQQQLSAIQAPTTSGPGLEVTSLVSPEPTAEAADPTAGWKTYKNTSANYTISYPENWRTGNVADGALNSEAVANARYVQIFPPQSGTGNVGIEELQVVPPSEEQNLTLQKTINNTALRCNNNYTTDTKTWCWIKVPNMDKYLNIQVFKGQNDSINQVFDLILSTFKFTE